MVREKQDKCENQADMSCGLFKWKNGLDRLGTSSFLENTGVMALGAVLLLIALIIVGVLFLLRHLH